MGGFYEHDVLVVGAGGAGLRAAIAAHEEGADAVLITKHHPVRAHTGAAEGGINAALRDATVTAHADDTMKGSDYLADAPAVEGLCQDAPAEIIQLERWGTPFSRRDDGRIALRYLAGHADPRTTYAGAETGHHVLQTLYEQVVKRGIAVYDEWYVTRLAVTGENDPEERTCHGVVAYDVATGEVAGFRARQGVILATGGVGQVYKHTTNAVANTGDGNAMAYRAGVPLEDMEFVQFHPTTLPSTGVLISEAVRGEGGRLLNADGERFMFERGYATNKGELASRDIISRAELTEIDEGRGIENDHVYLDMRHLGEDRIIDRLENILHLAADFAGIDALENPIPVKPGQHYAMGGIETDEYGATCIDGLYAVGECACASVHGANRLGGNAIPELLVFGVRAGRHAAGADLGETRLETGRSLAANGGRGGQELPGDRVVEDAVAASRRRIARLRERETDVQHSVIRTSVQTAVADGLNVFRTRAGIENALEEIRAARERYRDVSVSDPSRTFNTEIVQTIETRNLIDIAETIALGALARTESRGAHWRLDHPERNDDEWLTHTLVSWNDGEPSRWDRPVVLEGELSTYEPRERSY